MDDLKQAVLASRVIVILRGIELGDMVNTAQALYDGGVRLIEVTFDPRGEHGGERTLRAIALLRERFSGRLHVGAGTVLSVRNVEDAVRAGAQYLISPNVDGRVIERTKQLGALSVPGAMTPSEAVAAHAFGADFVKLFPANLLGPAYLKAVCAPLPHIPFLAVGGIDESNARDYILAGACGVGVGGSLVSPETVRRGEYSRMRERAARIVDAVGP